MEDNIFSDESDDEEVSLDQLREAYAKIAGRPAKPAEPVETRPTGEPAPDGLSNSVDGVRAGTSSRRSTEPTVHHSMTPIDDDAGCTISPQSIVEAMLFVGTPPGEQLTAKKIASMLRDVTLKEVLKMVEQLNARYEAEGAVYRIRKLDESLFLEIEDSMVPFQQELFGKTRAVKLNPANIEVLALVAYNQPVTRDQVDHLRKKPSGPILNQLVKRGLLEIAARENKSVPPSYITTEKFLNFFHLADLEDLPQSHDVGDIEELID